MISHFHLDRSGSHYSVSYRSRSEPDPKAKKVDPTPHLIRSKRSDPDSRFNIVGGSAVDFPLSPGSRGGSALVPTEDDLQGQMLYDPRHQGTLVVPVTL